MEFTSGPTVKTFPNKAKDAIWFDCDDLDWASWMDSEMKEFKDPRPHPHDPQSVRYEIEYLVRDTIQQHLRACVVKRRQLNVYCGLVWFFYVKIVKENFEKALEVLKRNQNEKVKSKNKEKKLRKKQKKLLEKSIQDQDPNFESKAKEDPNLNSTFVKESKLEQDPDIKLTSKEDPNLESTSKEPPKSKQNPNLNSTYTKEAPKPEQDPDLHSTTIDISK